MLLVDRPAAVGASVAMPGTGSTPAVRVGSLATAAMGGFRSVRVWGTDPKSSHSSVAWCGRKLSVCFQRFREESRRAHVRRPGREATIRFGGGSFTKIRKDVGNARALCRTQPLPIGVNPLRRHGLDNEIHERPHLRRGQMPGRIVCVQRKPLLGPIRQHLHQRPAGEHGSCRADPNSA